MAETLQIQPGDFSAEDFSIPTFYGNNALDKALEVSMVRRYRETQSGNQQRISPFQDPLGLYSSAASTPAPVNLNAAQQEVSGYINGTSVDIGVDENCATDDESVISNHSLSSADGQDEERHDTAKQQAEIQKTKVSANTAGQEDSFRSDISHISHHSLSSIASDSEDCSPRKNHPKTELTIIKDLRTELASIKELNQHLIANQQEAESLLRSKADALERLHVSYGELKVHYEDLTIKCDTMEGNYLEFKNALTEKSEELERVKKSHADKEAELAEKNAALKCQLASVTEQLNGFTKNQTHISAIRSALLQEKELEVLSVKREMLAEKEKILANLQAELEMEKEASQKKLTEQLRRNTEEFEKESQRKNDIIEALRRDLSEKDTTKLRTLQKEDDKYNERQRILDSLRNELDRLRTELTGKDTVIVEHLKTIQAERETIATKDKFIAELEAKISSLSFQLANRNTSDSIIISDTSEAVITNLKRQLDEKCEILARFRTEKEEKETKIAASKSEIASLRAKLHDLESQLQNERRQLTPRRPLPLPGSIDSKSIMPNEVEALRNRNEELVKTCEALMNSVKRSEEKLSHYQKKISDLEEKLSSYTRENKTLRSTLSRTSSMPNIPLDNQTSKIEFDKNIEKLESSLKKKQTEIDCLASTISTLQSSHEQEMKTLKMKYAKLYETSVRQMKQRLETDEIRRLGIELEETVKRNKNEVEKLEKRLAEKHEIEMKNMKAKYLETLNNMRDDIASGKQKSIEKMRKEWQKRKESIESLWKERMELMRQEYETILRQKNRTAVTSGRRFGGSVAENRGDFENF